MPDDSACASQNKVVFTSPDLTLDLRFVIEDGVDAGNSNPVPKIEFGYLDLRGQVRDDLNISC